MNTTYYVPQDYSRQLTRRLFAGVIVGFLLMCLPFMWLGKVHDNAIEELQNQEDNVRQVSYMTSLETGQTYLMYDRVVPREACEAMQRMTINTPNELISEQRSLTYTLCLNETFIIDDELRLQVMHQERNM